MSITFKQITDDSAVMIIDGVESVKAFQELVQRGTNLWPDAQPEIKELADYVTSGKVLQDYYGQAKDKIKIADTNCKHLHLSAINFNSLDDLYEQTCLSCGKLFVKSAQGNLK